MYRYIVEDLDAATKINLGVAVRNNHFGDGNDSDGGGGGGGGNGISEEEMDETVNSLLEMIEVGRCTLNQVDP
jgi:hypothetical protein